MPLELIKSIAQRFLRQVARAAIPADSHGTDDRTRAACHEAEAVVAVIAQIGAKRFHPFLFWFVIVATTTVGTTLADLLDRTLGIGYLGGTSIMFALVIARLVLWRWSLGSVSIDSIKTRKAEIFYWVTILFSQTLGTALGDWMADAKRGGLALLMARNKCWTNFPARLIFSNGSTKPDQANTVSAGID